MEILLLLLMNMQNNLYTIQFSHHLMTKVTVSPWAAIAELMDVANFTKFLKKTKLPEKFKLPGKWGFEFTEKRIKKKDSFLLARPPL